MELDLAKTSSQKPKMIFFDINGTLLPTHYNYDKDFYAMDKCDLFRQHISQLIQEGYTIGLNSDSPLVSMQKFATDMGLNLVVPKVAYITENGTVLYNIIDDTIDGRLNEAVAGLQQQEVEWFKLHIARICEQRALHQVASIMAPEFTASQPLNYAEEFAYGVGRSRSLTVFAESSVITEIGQFLLDEASTLGFAHRNRYDFDITPQFNCVAIHKLPMDEAITNYRQKKSCALQQIAPYCEELIMVGDSQSDITCPKPSNMRTYSVGASAKDLQKQYSDCVDDISMQLGMDGTNEILSRVILS